MRLSGKKVLSALLFTLPLSFILIFWGYFPLQYDIDLYTDNIVGEGICQSYGSQVDGHTAVNSVTFYFGSELKKATIRGAYYDVDTLYLVTSGVTEFDIIAIDSNIKGIQLTHTTPEDILPEGKTLEGDKGVLSNQNGVLHVDVTNPDEGTTLVFSQPFIPDWFMIIYFCGILLFALGLAVLLSLLFERIPALMLPLVSAACIMVTLIAGGFFCGSLAYMTYVNFLMNWLLVFAVALAINALTLPFLGTVATMIFITFCYIANYYVIALRGKPIMPADLKAIGTAREVMGGYTFTPGWKLIIGTTIIAFYGFTLILLLKHGEQSERMTLRRTTKQRGAVLASAIVLVLSVFNSNTFQNLNTFAWDTVLMKNFHSEGMVLSFLKSVYSSGVKRPEGYSKDIVNRWLLEYESVREKKSRETQPTRVIMVMNESFSDLRDVGLNTQVDVMPTIDSMSKNTVEGNLYVSVFGGGTCNTEFEALTGNSLAFLGVGDYPYTEYITKPVFSLAEYFRLREYATEAFHPNEADNWNRDIVYPNLGFEKFHSIRDFQEYSKIIELHDRPADISDYEYIESIDKEKNNQPRFLFDVTMQNHSPYDRWLDVEKSESVMRNASDYYLDTQVYLSLVKASDNQLQQLLEAYQSSDEATMIIFFGDHQPGLPKPAMKEVYTEVSHNLDLYKTKFFIWTNYDTKEWHNAGLSANYLPWLILERGNFPLPPYIQMLKELYAAYPVISSQGVIDKDGNVYDSISEVMDDPLIQKYQYIQYANLFDELDPAWFITR